MTRSTDGSGDSSASSGGAWNDVPFVVVNDGEVTALAGSMLSGVGALLGIAMGSSEAAGYVTPEGQLTSWLNELAFVPIDYAPDAPVDEWSGDRGCGVQYFSQQAVGRLLPAAGIEVDPAMPLPERLILLQRLMARDDPRALLVYETIGTYLGYALMEYRDFYEFRHLLLLGRVMTGRGGDVILERARDVLRAEEPALAGRHDVPHGLGAGQAARAGGRGGEPAGAGVGEAAFRSSRAADGPWPASAILCRARAAFRAAGTRSGRGAAW